MDLAVLEVPPGTLTTPWATMPWAEADAHPLWPVSAPCAPAAASGRVGPGERLFASGSVPTREPVFALPRRVSGAATASMVDVRGLGPGFVASLPGTVPGFSGGPVVDTQGRLVGMVIAIRRIPAAGERMVAPGALSDEVYVLAAEPLLAEARRIAARARQMAQASR